MAGNARKPKLGPNLYWRADIIWARFKVRGEEYRVSCHTSSPSVAEKRLKREREAVENQVIYGDCGPVSWGQAVLAWTAEPPEGVGASTLKRYATSLLQVDPWLRDLTVQEITTKILKDMAKARRRVVDAQTVKNDLTAISSVLDYAEEEEWVEDNVAHMMSRKKLKKKRQPIQLPEPAHISAVIADCPGAFAAMVEIAVETGMRQSEISRMEWHQVDLQRRSVQLYTTKGKKARAVPLSPRAAAILTNRPRYIGAEHVFWHDAGEPYANVSSRFAAKTKAVARKRAQADEPFRRFRFHDLRHFFAVDYLRRRRGSIYDLQKVMGHASIKTTEDYLDYLTPEEAAAINSEGGTIRGTAATVRRSAVAVKGKK